MAPGCKHRNREIVYAQLLREGGSTYAYLALFYFIQFDFVLLGRSL